MLTGGDYCLVPFQQVVSFLRVHRGSPFYISFEQIVYVDPAAVQCVPAQVWEEYPCMLPVAGAGRKRQTTPGAVCPPQTQPLIRKYRRTGRRKGDPRRTDDNEGSPK